MKSRRAIYIQAAKLVESGAQEFSCNAVDVAVERCSANSFQSHTSERRLYAVVMSPRSAADGHPLLVDDIEVAVRSRRGQQNEGLNVAMKREFRIWLLCMMAAAYEDLV